MDWLPLARQSLLAFGRRIGLSEDALICDEELEKVLLNDTSFSTAGLRDVTFSDVQALQSAFGSSLSGAIRVDALPILSLSTQATEADVTQFHLDATKHETVVLDLVIDKQILLEQRQPTASTYSRYCYFFSERFADLIWGALSEPRSLEESLFRTGSDVKVVVLLADNDTFCDGSFVAVLGGTHLRRMDEVSELSPIEAEQAAHVYSAMRESVRWDEEWTSFLTPRHLHVGDDLPSGDTIIAPLLANRTNLAILFMADRVKRRDQSVTAVFASEKARSEISLITNREAWEPLRWEDVESLGGLCDWAYEGTSRGDRIRMVQVSVARLLSFGEQPRKCEFLLQRAKQLKADLEWQWRTFISDEIERYSDEERSLEAEVAETVEAFDKQVSEMIGSLSTTMLAAVGVLIGSLIASVVKDTFKASIFMLGVYAYAAYLVLFPGLYNMIHHWLRFRAASNIFLKRQERLARVLDRSIIDRIVDKHVSRASCRFWCWFGATIAALTVVLVVCITAASVVPEIMAPTVSASPQANPTPAPPAKQRTP